MKKKMLFILAIVALIFFAPTVSAVEIEVKDDESLKSAFTDAKTGDTIKLTEDITHIGKALMVNGGRNLILDLNGKTLTIDPKLRAGRNDGDYRSITIYNGTLTVKNGTITHETHTAINVWGSETKKEDFTSKLVVEKDVTLNGLYGIAVYEDSKVGAYGVTVDFAGKIKAKELGITILGNIKQKDGEPIINVLDGSVIESDAIGIYAAGAGTWNLGNISVTGKGSALGIKSGKIIVNNGTYISTGEKEIPEAYGNGMNDSGSTIQIEANDGYYKNVELIINGGKFESKKSSVLLEYLGVENIGKENEKAVASETAVNTLEVNGGTFVQNSNSPVFIVSEELNKKIPQFITGGTYTSDISPLLKAGYKSYINDESNVVVEKIQVATGKNTITGKVDCADYSTITVQLKQGSKVLQISKLDEKGNYTFKDVANGTYNVVVVSSFTSQTLFVNVNKDTTLNIDATEVGSRLIVVGKEDMDVTVDGLDKISSDSEIVLAIGVVEEDSENEEQTALKEELKAKNYEFIEFLLANEQDIIDETDNVLMLAISYDFKDKENVTIARYHNGEISKFKEINALPENYEDGTFFADKDNGILYVFTSKFSTYAVTYDNVSSPQTGDGILNYFSIAIITLISLIGCGYFLKKKLYN